MPNVQYVVAKVLSMNALMVHARIKIGVATNAPFPANVRSPLGDVTEPPKVTSINGSRYQLSHSAWMALKALDVGYARIDRRDGVELLMLKLALHLSGSKFAITDAGRAVLYDDAASISGWGGEIA